MASTVVNRRTLLTGASAALCTLPWPLSAQAQTWPATTRIIIPLPAGGGVDVIMRKFGDALAHQLETAVIIDNKPGAAGVIAAKAAAVGAPDGSTILYLHQGLVTQQAIHGRLDILAEFKPVTKVTSGPLLLVVPGNSPYKTQAELVAAIQASPDRLNFGTGGNGSPTHMAFEWMVELVPGGLKATQIPYKGAIEAATGMMGGDIDFAFSPAAAVDALLKSGKLRALSTSGATRLGMLPKLPTVAEAGIPGYVFDAWGSLVVPVKTPDAVVARLAAATKAAATTPEFVALITRLGGSAETSTSPAAFAMQLKVAIAAEKKIIDRLGIKPE